MNSLANQEGNSKVNLDWRILAGVVISASWLLVLSFFLFLKMTWQQFLDLPLDQIDGFLSGAFSPLAFVWLIIGFFIQQGEIAENSRNIERQAEHSNLDNFLKKSDIVYTHLGVITGFLYISCREEIQESLSKPIDVDDLWTRSGNGDPGIFARGLARYRFYEDGSSRDMKKTFFSTDIRRNHVEKYQKIFEGLLGEAKESDCTGSLYDALNEGTVWGIFNRMINETRSEQNQKSETALVN